MEKNEILSERYGLNIYDCENSYFPYYVEEWDECFTEEEIRALRRDDLDFANIIVKGE